ncbi:MAG TPA: copper chaperone PCu(A)C [Acidimicrobiia bacterium]|jgi:copper(I)-binding protein|nr:copper chaperone PCu(A)C [Acidimicrobiia bacterium]
MRRLLLAGLIASSLLVACSGDDGAPEISDVRIGQPTGPNAALYLTATSNGAPDRLLGATTSVAASVELHETTMGSDGTMSMARIDRLDLPADGSLVLEPGGYHLMLVDADRLEVGETVEVTLIWETAGEMAVEAEVVDPGETLGDDH